ncbi:DUF1871 family protein [Domibacillus epiphyticus]|uniref:Uncharacterized protein n=1 Tax=Domibacillus epiphyticus TaxID=1714355 RepID=A0A1V2AA08_9BACI|nr:DUF1871 family protein [Domibacillus epiphyticus]OMP67770.1 hypothetical protein BTO28_04600 [Domibacillus epiphyticus]
MNETAQLNLALADVLNGFDPYNAGEGFYDTEIADSIYAVHSIDEINKLAAAIRSIYEHSFDMPMSGGNPTKLAEQLMTIKNNSSCSL